MRDHTRAKAAGRRLVGNAAKIERGFLVAARTHRKGYGVSTDLPYEMVAEAVARYPDRRSASTSGMLAVTVDPPLAGFSAWYEMFPRSAGDGKTHGTFRDVEAMLPYVAGMGFDVLYLPPIHPIGTTKRKGRNNALAAAPGDPGSPCRVILGVEPGMTSVWASS